MKLTKLSYYQSLKRPEMAVKELESGRRVALVLECRHCKRRVGRIMKIDDIMNYLRTVFRFKNGKGYKRARS